MNSDAVYIQRVRRMDLLELLDEVMEHPLFLTDSYYADFGRVIRERYEQLRRNPIQVGEPQRVEAEERPKRFLLDYYLEERYGIPKEESDGESGL